MAEQFRSITEARKELPSLSQAVQRGADRFVITNQGKPQAVLMGYREYKGLLAAVELLNRPSELDHLREGLAQTERLSFEQVKENLRRRKAGHGRLATAPIVSFGEKLDEINGNLKRIMRRLGDAERVASLPEQPHAKPKAFFEDFNMEHTGVLKATRASVAGRVMAARSFETGVRRTRERITRNEGAHTEMGRAEEK